MSSLMDSLKKQVSPDLIINLATKLGESGDSVQKAMQGGSATMLATLASKAQEPGFLSQIRNLITGSGMRSAMGAAAGGGPSVVSDASQVGSSFLSTLFGNNLSGIQNKIAEFSGIRTSSAGSILSMAARMVMSMLASTRSIQDLSASGLGNLLTSELPKLRSFLPNGLTIQGLAAGCNF